MQVICNTVNPRFFTDSKTRITRLQAKYGDWAYKFDYLVNNYRHSHTSLNDAVLFRTLLLWRSHSVWKKQISILSWSQNVSSTKVDYHFVAHCLSGDDCPPLQQMQVLQKYIYTSLSKCIICFSGITKYRHFHHQRIIQTLFDVCDCSSKKLHRLH